MGFNLKQEDRVKKVSVKKGFNLVESGSSKKGFNLVSVSKADLPFYKQGNYQKSANGALEKFGEKYKVIDEYKENISKNTANTNEDAVSNTSNTADYENKKDTLIISDYESKTGLTKEEYYKRRRANVNLPEYGSYQFFVNREKEVGKLLDEAEKNNEKYNADVWQEGYKTFKENPQTAKQAGESTYNFFVQMDKDIEYKDRLFEEYANIVEQLNKFETDGVHYDEKGEIDTKSGIEEAQRQIGYSERMASYYAPKTDSEFALSFSGDGSKEQMKKYDTYKNYALQGQIEHDKEKAYKYYEKHKNNAYDDNLFGKFAGNYRTGDINENIGKTGFGLYSANSNDLEAVEIYKILQQRLQNENKAAFTNKNAFDSGVAAIANYIPQFINQTKARIGGYAVGAIAGMGTGASVAGARFGGAAASAGYMFRQTAGMTYVDLLQNSGLSIEDAKKLASNTALASSSVEFGLEMLIGGLWKGSSKAAEKVIKKPLKISSKDMVNKLVNKGISQKGAQIMVNSSVNAAKLTLNSLGEGTEEWIQTGIEKTANRYAKEGKSANAVELFLNTFDFSKYSDDDFKEMNQSFLAGTFLGYVSGGVNAASFNTIGKMAKNVDAASVGKKVLDLDDNADIIKSAVTYGAKSDNARARSLAGRVSLQNRQNNISKTELGELVKIVTQNGKNVFANNFQNVTQSQQNITQGQENVTENAESVTPNNEGTNNNTYEHLYDEKHVSKEFINSVNPDIEQAIVNIRNKNSASVPDIISINSISENTKGQLGELVGFDVSDYSCKIEKDALEHIEKRHGINGEHDNSLADPKDIARIEYVINNFDSIDFATDEDGNYIVSKKYNDRNNNPAPIIVLTKKIDGTFCVSQVVPDSKRKTIWLTSARIQKADGGSQVPNGNNVTPQLTPEAPLVSSSANNIIQQEKIKVNNSNMQNGGENIQNDNPPTTFGGSPSFTQGGLMAEEGKEASGNQNAKNAIRLEKLLEMRYGAKFKHYYSEDGVKGFYKDGVSYINDFYEQDMYSTSVHEFLHQYKDIDPEGYSILKKAIENDLSIAKYNEYKNNVINDLKNEGIEYDESKIDDLVIEEAISDIAMEVFKNPKSIDSVAKRFNNDMTVMEKLIEFIRGIANKIKSFIAEGNFEVDDDIRSIVNNFNQIEDVFNAVLASGAKVDGNVDITNDGDVKYRMDKLIGKTFPPYNESQSDANEQATRWAHNGDIEAGAQRIFFYKGSAYLVEKFESMDLGYLVVEKLNKRDMAMWNAHQQRKGDSKNGKIEAEYTGSGRVISGNGQNRGSSESTRRSSNDDNSSDRHNRETSKVQRVDREQDGERSSQNYRSGDNEYSFKDRQDEIDVSAGGEIKYRLDTSGNKRQNNGDVKYRIDRNHNLFDRIYSLKNKQGILYNNGNAITIPNTDMAVLRHTYKTEEHYSNRSNDIIDCISCSGKKDKKHYFYVFYKGEDGAVAPIFRMDYNYLDKYIDVIREISKELGYEGNEFISETEAVYSRFDEFRSEGADSGIDDYGNSEYRRPTEIGGISGGQEERGNRNNEWTGSGISYGANEGINNKQYRLDTSGNKRQNNGEQFNVMWTIEEGVLTDEDIASFYSKLSELHNNNYKNYKMSQNGEYIFSVKNKLIYSDGDYYFPSINSVITFLTNNENLIDYAREIFYDGEIYKREFEMSKEIVEAVLGEETIKRTNQNFSKTYKGSKNNNGKRGNGKAVDSGNREKLVDSEDNKYRLATKAEMEADGEIRYRLDRNHTKQLKLPKEEYALVSRAIMAKNAGLSDAELKSTDYVYAADEFYVYNNYSIGEFAVINKISIVGNEELINYIRGEVENGTYRSSEAPYTLVKEYKSRRGINNRNNGRVERTEAHRNDAGLSVGQPRSNAVGHSGRNGSDNRGGINNSSDSDTNYRLATKEEMEAGGEIKYRLDTSGNKRQNNGDVKYRADKSDDYSQRALPIGSMKNKFHSDLSNYEWVQYYDVVNKFDWDESLRTKDFSFVVKLGNKTILSTYRLGKPEVYFVTDEINEFEEGVLYDRSDAERILRFIGENEIQRNKTSGDGINAVGKETNGNDSTINTDSKASGDGRGVYDEDKSVYESDTFETVKDDSPGENETNYRLATKEEMEAGGEIKYRFARNSRYGVNWTLNENVLNNDDISMFYRTLGEKEKGLWFPKTLDNEYIFESDNKLIYTDGKYVSPTITRVITFEGMDENEVEYGKELVWNGALNGKSSKECCEIAQSMLGKGTITSTDTEDSRTYWKGGNDKREGTISRRDISANAIDSEDNKYRLATKAEMEEAKRYWEEKIKKYGAIPKGENPKRDIEVPKKISEKKLVSRFARTMLEAGITPDDAVSEFEKAILNGDMTHEVIENEKAEKYAKGRIKTLGFKEAVNEWEVLSGTGKVGKKELALGMELYNQSITKKDTESAMKIAAALAAEATRAGQTLQALRMLKLMNTDGQLYYIEKSLEKMNEEFKAKLGRKYKDIKLNEEYAKEFFTAEEEDVKNTAYDKLCQDIADQIPPTFKDKWDSWRYLAMLGNPRTHIRNIVGNAIFVPAVRIKNLVGATIERWARIETGERTKALRKSKEAISFAKKDFELIKKDIQGVNAKYATTSDIEGKRRIFKSNILEKARTKNFDFLEKEDMWFLKIHYTDALASIITARGLNIENLSGEALEKARAYAIKRAQEATYRDANDLAAALNKIQRQASLSDKKAVRFAGALMEGVVPFKKTPLNIAKQGMLYSPYSILSGMYKTFKNLKEGNVYSATDVIDSFAKGLTGTGIMLVGLFLASMGFLKGGEDENDKKRRFDKMVGEQAYSLNLFGKSYTIDWAAPMSLPLFIGVELHSLTENRNLRFKDFLGAMSKIYEPLLEMTVFSGISDTIKTARYNETNEVSAVIFDMAASYFGQALPSVGGQISKIFDKTKRNYYYNDEENPLPKGIQNIIGQISGRIPLVSYLFEPNIDEWGREETYGNAFERTFESALSPGYYSEKNYTEVDEELKRLYDTIGDAKVFPVVQQKFYKQDKVRYDMSAKEYTAVKRIRGRKSFELVQRLIKSGEYQKMSDEEKAEAIEGCYKKAGAYAKQEMIAKIME